MKKLSLLLLTLSIALAGTAAETSKKPNVIFFFLDDSGWGDFSCYGNEDLKTPNFDKVAAEGVLFTNFYVAASVCSPSRCSAMTGQFSGRLGVHHIFGSDEKLGLNTCKYLDLQIPNITSAFHNAGYFTGHFGKWHLNTNKEAPTPDKYGIDRHKTIGKGFGNNFVFPKGVPQNSLSTEYIMDESLNFLKEAKESGKPFYLQIWTILPHASITPTPEQLARVPKHNLPFQGKPEGEKYTSRKQIYYSAILEVDYQFGRLIEALKKEGLYEDTIIIISSDNGPETEEIANSVYSAGGRTGVFRGNKRSIYEGGIRVAGIISWPQEIKQGKIDKDTVMSTVDLFPSLAKICGLECPYDKVDGEDMSQAFYGKSVERKKPLYWSFFSNVYGHPNAISPNLAIRQGKWKFMMNFDGTRAELYDLDADPKQVDNVAAENSEVVARLKPMLAAYYESLPNKEKVIPHSGEDTTNYNRLVTK